MYDYKYFFRITLGSHLWMLPIKPWMWWKSDEKMWKDDAGAWKGNVWWKCEEIMNKEEGERVVDNCRC